MTLTFTAAQAILAAEVGAYIVSPFLGRLDDIATDSLRVLSDICEIYGAQGYQTQVLAASLRHPVHVVEAARMGADIATMPFKVFETLVVHPLTDAGFKLAYDKSYPIGTQDLSPLIGEAQRSGADTFVAGTAVYGAADPAEAVRRLRGLVAGGDAPDRGTRSSS
jgi:transaldolase